jgi:hypothetical protein
MPTQLNIVLANSLGTVTFPISAGLQALDSGNSSGSGQVSQLNATTGLWSTGQTGFSSVDETVRNIARAGGFWTTVAVAGVPTRTFYSTAQIQSITWT